MNIGIIKNIVYIVTILFILILSNTVYKDDISSKLLIFELKVQENHLLSKDINAELRDLLGANYVNYDNINYKYKELFKNTKKLALEYPSNDKVKKLKKLIFEQKDYIDMVKRTNSIISNSFSYIKSLSKIEDKKFRKNLEKIIDYTYGIKVSDKATLNEYLRYLNNLKNIKIDNKELLEYKKKILMHIDTIYKNTVKLQHSITKYNHTQDELCKIYYEINTDVKNRYINEKKILKYSQVAIFILLLVLIVLIYILLKTLRKEVQEQKKYRELVSKHIITSTTDLKGVITGVSEAYCRVSGYDRDELIGQPHNIIRHPDMPKSTFKDMWKSIKAGKKWHGKIKNLKKDGGFYWLDAVIEPIYNNKGKIESYLSVKTDITNRIALEELSKTQEAKIKEAVLNVEHKKDKLEKALKAKSEFLANMSHEIRTPLNAILGFIDLLKEESKGRKSLEYVNIIDSSSKSLLQIIEDILDFSKIESGKLDIDKVDFNTKSEFEVITYLFNAKASEKKITLILNLDENLPKTINTDPLRIKQIISNLLSNAIKFTDSGKKITVDISYKDNKLFVSVKDEGKGIAKDKLSHIFDAFSQEDSSTTREFGGTGLGLTISSRLVKLLGGELNVKSKVGVGSEFYFYIPVEIGKEVAKLEVNQKEITFDKYKILLAEDNKANQMFMKLVLKKLKLKFDIASDGLEAVEAFKQNKYDAILMDENMPNMSGIEATKEILKIEKDKGLKHTPIVALTANALKGDRERFISVGMDEYMTKPLDKRKLSDILRKILLNQ